MAGIYIEFTYQGAYVKVTAIDAESGLEASVVGPQATPQSELEKLALKKLDFVRKRSAPDEKDRAENAKDKTGRGRTA